MNVNATAAGKLVRVVGLVGNRAFDVVPVPGVQYVVGPDQDATRVAAAVGLGGGALSVRERAR
jgi:hypothetical protein